MAPRRKPHLGRPKGANQTDTRARVLVAARACFSRTGFAATTNKDIADEAGVTTAALYLYHPSKTHLYRATVRQAYTELLPHYQSAASSKSIREGFRAVLAASGPLHRGDPSLAKFFSALPVDMARHPEVADAIREEGAAIVALFFGIVERGVRDKEITADQAPNVLSLFIACTMGFALFVTSIDDSQLDGILATFASLIDGTLFLPAKKTR